MDRRDFLSLAAAVAASSAMGSARSFAQGKYPSRPIRLAVAYPPGGVVDVVARHWADRVKETLGIVVVENQPGAGGTIASSAVARSPADGYRLLFGETSSLTIAPALMKDPPYHAVKDFSPVSMIATSSTSIVVHPSVPAKTLGDFIKLVQQDPEKFTYGSAGTGTVTHLAGELFKQKIGAPGVLHIPYRGAGPAMSDLIANAVPFSTPNITSQILSWHQAGLIRILAVCAPARLRVAPELPIASEVLPDMVMQLTAGIVAPAGTPEDILTQLSSVTAQALKDPKFEQALEASGLESRPDSSPAGARAVLAAERERLLPIMKIAGLEAQ